MPLRSAAANTHFHLFYIYMARVWGNWVKVFFRWEGINNLRQLQLHRSGTGKKGKGKQQPSIGLSSHIVYSTNNNTRLLVLRSSSRLLLLLLLLLLRLPSWKHYITRRWWPAGWVSGISIHSFSGHWQQEASKKVVRRAVRRHFLPQGVCERERERQTDSDESF